MLPCPMAASNTGLGNFRQSDMTIYPISAPDCGPIYSAQSGTGIPAALTRFCPLGTSLSLINASIDDLDAFNSHRVMR